MYKSHLNLIETAGFEQDSMKSYFRDFGLGTPRINPEDIQGLFSKL